MLSAKLLFMILHGYLDGERRPVVQELPGACADLPAGHALGQPLHARQVRGARRRRHRQLHGRRFAARREKGGQRVRAEVIPAGVVVVQAEGEGAT